jgi:hypothetical protein
MQAHKSTVYCYRHIYQLSLLLRLLLSPCIFLFLSIILSLSRNPCALPCTLGLGFLLLLSCTTSGSLLPPTRLFLRRGFRLLGSVCFRLLVRFLFFFPFLLLSLVLVGRGRLFLFGLFLLSLLLVARFRCWGALLGLVLGTGRVLVGAAALFVLFGEFGGL